MKRRVTLAMIAEACGTSIGTVDRALNDRPGINQQTKQQILEAAENLGYCRNLRSKHRRIALVDYNSGSSLHNTILRGAACAKAEVSANSIDVDIFTSSRLDEDAQCQLLDKVYDMGFDAVLVNALGGKVDAKIGRFIQAGIPIATFNTDAPNTRRLFYVGCDDTVAGKLSGELVGKMIIPNQAVVVVGNFVRQAPSIHRFSGFCEVIQKDFSRIHLVPRVSYYQDEDGAEQEITRIIQEYDGDDLSMIYVIDHTGTVGAIRALKALNRKDIHLFGYDPCPIVIDALQDRWCTAAIYQNPYLQAVKLMAEHLLSGWVPRQSPCLNVVPRFTFKYNATLQDDLDFFGLVTEDRKSSV